MTEPDHSFRRSDMLPSRCRLRRGTTGPVAGCAKISFRARQIRSSRFSVAADLSGSCSTPVYNFLIGNAVFTDPEGLRGEACRFEGVGACWIFIQARFNFFIYGFYPARARSGASI